MGVLLATALLFATPIEGRAQESGFEKFEPRSARDVVSGSLVEGPHYRLAPTVQTFAFQNHFVVSSDYGIFEAKSEAMLRRLVREIHAIGVLHDITLTDAYGKALGQAAMGPVRGVEALIANPVDTVAAVPTAVFDVFSRVGQGENGRTSQLSGECGDGALAGRRRRARRTGPPSCGSLASTRSSTSFARPSGTSSLRPVDAGVAGGEAR
jgi:hypothetical protein